MSKKQKKKQKKQKTGNRLFSLQKEFSKAYEFHTNGETEKAEELYRKIIRKDPQHSDALHLLGVIALERSDNDSAVNLFNRAIKSYPHAAPYYNNLGLVYRNKGLLEDAARAYRKALEIDPDYAEAHNNLGTLLKGRGDITDAIECFEHATRLNTGFSTAYYNLGTVLCDQGRIPAAIVAYRNALAIKPDFTRAFSNLLYTLHLSDSISPDTIFSEHQEWGAAFAKPLTPLLSPHENDANPDRKLRIGYVSPDFCTHSVAFFLENVLLSHNRNQVEIFCYSNTIITDAVTERFMDMSDHWRDITRATDGEAAAIIRMDAIDILVDLAGHTRNSRMVIFSLKPAPVQVSWLGYPDTTGMDVMDYRITDAVADPPGVSERLYTETLYRMPECFLCYKPSGQAQAVMESPFKKNGSITFGSFNNTSKISPKTIELWSRILKGVPDSRLKLKSKSFSDFGTRKYILDLFASQGILNNRIWFEGYSVTLNEHFMLYNTIDIALDTYPYHGTTTTCEALWMGVPVITLKGDTHVSRVAVSILTTIGAHDLIADSPDEYVNKAVLLAKDTDLLSMFRSRLRNMMMTSPLMDPAGFTQSLEDGYRAMWNQWCESGKQPENHRGISVNAETMHAVYLKNLETLRAHHPHIEPLLEQPLPFESEIRFSDSGVPNLYIIDNKGSSKSIYPEDNPLRDLPALIKKIRDFKGKTLCVLGAGLCLHAGPIIESIGDMNLIIFFEAFPAFFKSALMTSDLETMLTHPNVRLAIGDSADPYSIINTDQDKIYTNSDGEFIEYNNVVSLNAEWYRNRKKIFDQFFKRRRISKDTAAFAGKQFLENSFKNLFSLAESSPLNVLNDCYRGIPAIIVASGPSLTKNIREIKKADGRALIIAVDSALAPLMNEGIKPHMVVSVDYNDFTYEKLAPYIEELNDVSLVYIPIVTSKILNSIRFRAKYYAFPDPVCQKLMNRLLKQNGNALEDIHSVIHLAIATAQNAGCDPIIFTGLDLAYSGTGDHADGTLLHWGNNHTISSEDVMIESINGTSIPSHKGFVGIIEICNRMIHTVSDRTYIDATEGGAKIDGTQIMALSEAINILKPGTVGISNTDSGRFPVVSNGLILNQLKLLKKDLKQCLQLIFQYEHEQKTSDDFCYNTGKMQVNPDVLPAKVKDSLRKMDKVNSILDAHVVISYLQGYLSEYYDEYRKHELDVIQKTSIQDKQGRFLAILKQQTYIQSIRKKALLLLAEHVGQSIDILEGLNEISDSVDTISFNTELYFNHGLFNRAESCVSDLPESSMKCFYMGAIYTERRQIEKARQLFDKAIELDINITDRVNQFIEGIVNTWVDGEGPSSYQRIMVEYAYRLSPENRNVSLIWQKHLFDDAHEMLVSNQAGDALALLMKEYSERPFDYNKLLGLFSFLLIESGYDDDGIRHLKQWVSDQMICSEREQMIKQYWQDSGVFNAVTPDSGWLSNVIKLAGDEPWARRLLQEFWWMTFNRIDQTILLKQMSPDKCRETEIILNKWEMIKEKIPEWYFLKSVCQLGTGHFNTAEKTIQNAIHVGKKMIPFYLGNGFPVCISAIFQVVQDNVDEAITILSSYLKTSEKEETGWKIILAILLICQNDEAAGEQLLNTTISTESPVDWHRKMAEDLKTGGLVNEIRKLRNIRAISAFHCVIARYHLETGHIEGGINSLRAAINYDPYHLMAMDMDWMWSPIEEKWNQDIELIEQYISTGQFSNAENLLSQWEATRPALDNYDVVRSIIIEKQNGMEKAIDYLQSCYDEQKNNAEYLYHYSKLLFVSGNREKSRSVLEKAVNINPEAAVLWEDIGDVWMDENEFQKAIDAYEKCITVLPGKTDSLRKVGDAYKAMGVLDSAAAAYQAVLNTDTSDQIAKDRLNEIMRQTSKS